MLLRPTPIAVADAAFHRVHVINRQDAVAAAQIENQLQERYGYLMTPLEVASVFRLESVNALRMARRRGKVELSPVASRGRTQLFSTKDVARLLDEWLTGNQNKETATCK
jgi:hypothetical protein